VAPEDEHVERRERLKQERYAPAQFRDDEKAYSGGQDPTISPEALQQHEHPPALFRGRDLGDERVRHR
jgi:hypothetical protein